MKTYSKKFVAKELLKIAKSLQAAWQTPNSPNHTTWLNHLDRELSQTLSLSQSAKPEATHYLTFIEGTSNKYHYFGIYKDGDTFVCGNVWGKIGRIQGSMELARGDHDQVYQAMYKKLKAKLNKGYQEK